ncbi:MAG: hypothetical protein HOM34_04775 [Planctomycetes bacterium]|jgi:hypothetical protein|nr:hypothetical protein [Planctomycetota bacterium]MBT4029007.1 hypothetical protein [Planctomycetota bacterium]MBT4560275.1 hypothetical protein [Planctomycetota bacterium]MBT5101024.1 hypothetical protein [Planctomycetota bacterium]MBT5120018.1 hypothetical protein [Planctomycetota bacterium]
MRWPLALLLLFLAALLIAGLLLPSSSDLNRVDSSDANKHSTAQPLAQPLGSAVTPRPERKAADHHFFGQVMDQNNKPVPNARVVFWITKPAEEYIYDDFTDEDGRFSFYSPKANSAIAFAFHEQYSVAKMETTCLAEKEVKLRLIDSSHFPITGFQLERIIDQNGEGIPELSLEWAPLLHGKPLLPMFKHKWDGNPFGGNRFRSLPSEGVVFRSAETSYISADPFGEVIYLLETMQGEKQSIQLSFSQESPHKGDFKTGQIIDAVSLSPVSKAKVEGAQKSQLTHADSNGSFSYPTQEHILISHQNFFPASFPWSVDSDPMCYLKPYASISGDIVFTDRHQQESQVTVAAIDIHSKSNSIASVDSFGQFKLEHLPPGTYFVSLRSEQPLDYMIALVVSDKNQHLSINLNETAGSELTLSASEQYRSALKVVCCWNDSMPTRIFERDAVHGLTQVPKPDNNLNILGLLHSGETVQGLPLYQLHFHLHQAAN